MKSMAASEDSVVPWTTRSFGASPEAGPAIYRLTLAATAGASNSVAVKPSRRKKKKTASNPNFTHPAATLTTTTTTAVAKSPPFGTVSVSTSNKWVESLMGSIASDPNTAPGLATLCGIIQASYRTQEDEKTRFEKDEHIDPVSSIGSGWSHGSAATAALVGLATDTPLPLPSPKGNGYAAGSRNRVKVPFGAVLDSVHPEFLEGRTGGMLYLVLRASGLEGEGIDDEPCSYAPIAVHKGTRLRFQPPPNVFSPSSTAPGDEALSSTASFDIRSECREDACVMARLIERRSNQEGFSEKWQQVATGFIPLKEWLESICVRGNKSAAFVVTLYETGRVVPRSGDDEKRKTFVQTFACVRIQMTGRKGVKNARSGLSNVQLVRLSPAAMPRWTRMERDSQMLMDWSSALRKSVTGALGSAPSPYAVYANGQSQRWEAVYDEAPIYGRGIPALFYFLMHQRTLPPEPHATAVAWVAHFVRLVCLQESITIPEYRARCQDTGPDVGFVSWFLSKTAMILPWIMSYTRDHLFDDHTFPLASCDPSREPIDCEEIASLCSYFFHTLRGLRNDNDGKNGDDWSLVEPLQRKLSEYTIVHLYTTSRVGGYLSDPASGKSDLHVVCSLIPTNWLSVLETTGRLPPAPSSFSSAAAVTGIHTPVVILDPICDAETILTAAKGRNRSPIPSRLRTLATAIGMPDVEDLELGFPSWMNISYSAETQLRAGYKVSILSMFVLDSRPRQSFPVTFDPSTKRWQLGMSARTLWSGGSENPGSLAYAVWTPDMPRLEHLEAVDRFAAEWNVSSKASRPQFDPSRRQLSDARLNALVEAQRRPSPKFIKAFYIHWREKDQISINRTRIVSLKERLVAACSQLDLPSKKQSLRVVPQIAFDADLYVMDSFADVSFVQLFLHQ